MSDPTFVCFVSAVTALVENGIEPDVIGLLVSGEPSRGIAPGALKKAVKAALRAHAQSTRDAVIEECAQAVEKGVLQWDDGEFAKACRHNAQEIRTLFKSSTLEAEASATTGED